MTPMDWLYILPAPLFLFGLLIAYCYFWEKQVVYFRVTCNYHLDIDYTDYVFNYPFFDNINKQLESHLILYVKEHFYSLGIPYKSVKITTEVNYKKAAVACYLEITRKQQKIVQRETLSCVNIAKEIQQFYRFVELVKNPKYEQITRMRGMRAES